jgi:hypothetical protein
VLRAASVALTEKVWEPLAKPVYFLGEEQAPKAPPSSWHSKVEFASEEENVNEALFCFTVPEGPESMVVSGGVVSCGGGAVLTVQVRVAGVASTLPAPSLALTEKVCEPSARTPCSGTVFGELHEAKAPPSREHSKVEPASEEENVNVAEVLLTVPDGPEGSKVVSGGVVSDPPPPPLVV